MVESKKIINARYNPEANVGSRLEIDGPFDRKTIDEVIKKQPPYSFSQRASDKIWEASFVVYNPKSASELVDRLNNKLQDYGFFIRYVGPSQ